MQLCFQEMYFRRLFLLFIFIIWVSFKIKAIQFSKLRFFASDMLEKKQWRYVHQFSCRSTYVFYVVFNRIHFPNWIASCIHSIPFSFKDLYLFTSLMEAIYIPTYNKHLLYPLKGIEQAAHELIITWIYTKVNLSI